MRTTPFIAALTSALLLAACASPEHETGDAAPAGTAAPTTSAPAVSAPAASALAASSAPAAGAEDVLGPNGIGALRLGMTKEQALATGIVTAFTPPDLKGCMGGHLKGAPGDTGTVVLSKSQGLVSVDAYGSTIHTPEGARIGMTRDELTRTYGDWQPLDGDGVVKDGRGYARARGNDLARYRIVTVNGKVTELSLMLVDDGCYK
ncbi:hypothetical protein [Dactylosporangium sp. NPDC051484]|uniref:hypothetical protein n=1 Tax=Dactylosporangium sp. NPDC051484 TaxID=3154942 RepID=UPI00344C05A5